MLLAVLTTASNIVASPVPAASSSDLTFREVLRRIACGKKKSKDIRRLRARRGGWQRMRSKKDQRGESGSDTIVLRNRKELTDMRPHV